MARRLVIDADLNKRLATELKARGIEAVSASELQIKGLLDPVLLENLHDRFPDGFVLVTADDHMPLEHADTIARLGSTIAVVDPTREPDVPIDTHRRNIVHRHAESMSDQTSATVLRYGARKTKWTKPRRPKRSDPTRTTATPTAPATLLAPPTLSI